MKYQTPPFDKGRWTCACHRWISVFEPVWRIADVISGSASTEQREMIKK